MITLLPPTHLRRQQRSDGGYDMVPAYTADEVRSHMLSWAENRVAEERERFIDALGAACISAELPDSKYESLLIALRCK